MLKKFLVVSALSSSLLFSGCSRVEPNEIGVLVQNYGKDVDKDYSLATGRVMTASPGTSLYVLPTFEQRNEFEKPIINKSGDGTEFSVKPRYSYKINRDKATSIVREYAKIFGQSADLKAVEEKALDPTIADIIRDIIVNSSSSDLMAEGGNAKFTAEARKRIEKAFSDRGFILMSFSTVLDYSASVKASIDARNQANSQIATIDSQIIKARKENELAAIQATTTITQGQAITDQQLQLELIQKWNGQLPTTYICNDKSSPLTMMLSK